MKKINLKISHLSFSLIFTSLLYVICNALNFDKISKWFYTGADFNYMALCAYLVIGFALFLTFFLLLAHKWTIKPLAITLLALSTAATYFIAKYNVAIDRTMVMNTVYTDVTEATGLLSVYMIPYLIFLLIIPIALILKVKIKFKPAIKHVFSSFITITLSLMLAVGLLYLNFNQISQAVNISNKYVVHTLVPVNVIRSGLSAVQRSIEPFLGQKKQVEIIASVAKQEDLVVVLAIGEAARQKNLSLYGYDRKQTTPILSEINELHTLNGIASIGSTLYALPKILEKYDIKLPAITAKVGIDTACYSNFSLYDNCEPVGQIMVSDCKYGSDCYDEDVIPLLEKNLENYNGGYRFVVLHIGGGSHGPRYNDRYPPEYAKFTPTCNDADVVNQCTKEELYNSYDNTIRYLDYVLGSIVDTLETSKSPYVMIYLSDHGESLFEEGRIFHGMPPGISLPAEQAQIPLLIKSSVPISIDQRDEYYQPDVFDTVLSLFSIESAQFTENNGFIQKQTKQIDTADFEVVSEKPESIKEDSAQ